MSGQPALGLGGALVAAALWETLPAERQPEVTVMLAEDVPLAVELRGGDPVSELS